MGTMPSASVARDQGLDVLRIGAVALLLLAHGVAIFYTVFPNQRLIWFLGCWGMDLFFVLGGYLLARRVLDEGGMRTGALLRERALRILPNYALFILVGIGLAWLADGQWRTPLRYWLFIQNLARPHPAFLPELWGLATAVSSGLGLMLAHALLLRRIGSRAAFVLVLLVIAAANLLRLWHVLSVDPLWDEEVKKITAWRLDALAYGYLAAHVRRADWLQRVSRGVLALVATSLLALVFVLYASGDENHSLFARTLLFAADGVGFAVLLLAVVGVSCAVEGSTRRRIRLLAGISYALFLCHLPVLRILELLNFPRDNVASCALQAIAWLLASAALAHLVHRYWEQAWRTRSPSPARRLVQSGR